ncbi:MAG: winged helix DNA-binding domain-containing protein, partial [Actinomycetota bacterium]|nr:winged helix DNA-binding domain-containing protein [Actinomycetota bacterium]
MATPPSAERTPWIRAARMRSLLLDDPQRDHPDVGTRTPLDVVEWFGAMQGQDLGSVQWSLGLRTGLTRADIAVALESGEVLRTWPMRGTLHLVPGRDARWMLEHLGARALAGAATRRA